MASKRYTYQHTVGLAAHHAELSAEMAALDLAPDTPVTVVGHDAERDLVIVEWQDSSGNPRTTSVDPLLFAEYFVKG